MMRIAIDDETLVKLHNLDGRIEICNQRGETLGFFVPRNEREKEYQGIYHWAKSAIRDAEIDKSLQDAEGQPLAEILQELESKWPIR